MPNSTFADLVQVQINSATSSGFVIGVAVPSYQGKEQLINGATYSYSIQVGSNYEYGKGVWFVSSNTLSRQIYASSYGGNPIPIAAGTPLNITILAEDLRALKTTNNPTYTTEYLTVAGGNQAVSLSFMPLFWAIYLNGQRITGANGTPVQSGLTFTMNIASGINGVVITSGDYLIVDYQ